MVGIKSRHLIFWVSNAYGSWLRCLWSILVRCGNMHLWGVLVTVRNSMTMHSLFQKSEFWTFRLIKKYLFFEPCPLFYYIRPTAYLTHHGIALCFDIFWNFTFSGISNPFLRFLMVLVYFFPKLTYRLVMLFSLLMHRTTGYTGSSYPRDSALSVPNYGRRWATRIQYSSH